MKGPYKIHYNDYGTIDGITCHGYTVLQLVAGTERNNEMAEDIVSDLNANDAVEAGTRLSDWCKEKMKELEAKP